MPKELAKAEKYGGIGWKGVKALPWCPPKRVKLGGGMAPVMAWNGNNGDRNEDMGDAAAAAAEAAIILLAKGNIGGVSLW